jgi:hypothetical protein
MKSLDFFQLTYPSSCSEVLELTEPLTEMSTSNLPGGGLNDRVRKADSLTSICELMVVMRDP